MTCGMAAGFAAMNSVFGRFFKVDAAEFYDAAAASAMKTDYFIFDVQTHHVAAGRHFIESMDVFGARHSAGQFNPALKGREPKQSDFELENYIKEVFLDSDTGVACLSGIPDITDAKMVIPPDEMVRTRNIVNELTRSQRMMSHGLFSPDLGTKNLENMHKQAESLKIDAWKGAYPKIDGYFADLVDILRDEVEELIRLGCTYIQIDSPQYAALLDPQMREG
jgi:uncharacterized protein